jgi:peptide/nickel transport system permease protein
VAGQDAAYPLGSDSLGRDVVAGIAHGARVSLAVGVVAAVLSLLIGMLVGATAGYFGGIASTTCWCASPSCSRPCPRSSS